MCYNLILLPVAIAAFSGGACCHLPGTFLQLHSNSIVLGYPLNLLVSYTVLVLKFKTELLSNTKQTKFESLLLVVLHITLFSELYQMMFTRLTSHLYSYKYLQDLLSSVLTRFSF